MILPYRGGVALIVEGWNPVQWDITVPAGADFERDVLWEFNGSPVPLNGYSARQDFRRRYMDEEPILSITDGDGLLLGGDTGLIHIRIPAAHMRLLGGDRPLIVVTALELTSPEGKVYRLFDGKWTVTPEATK